MSYRGGRGRGGRNNYNAFPRNNDNMMAEGDPQNMPEVTVREWNQAPKDDLMSFIKRKTDVALQNVYVTPNGELHANVFPNEARKLEKYNGQRFAGKALAISVKYPQGMNNNDTSGNPTMTKLRNFLQPRYDAQMKMLNLTNMKNDPALVSLGNFTPSKMFQALMKVATDEARLQVDTVDLSNNLLQDVTPVTTLSQSYPNLKNLSLANNDISRVKGLDQWRHKFPHLRELILTGNRVTQEAGYKDELLKMFPRLVMLDGVVVRDEQQLNIPTLPHPMKQSFYENPDIQNMSNGFLNSYFQLYDSDRTQLMQLYDDMSMLSLSYDGQAPRVLAGQVPSASAYIPLSRNLIKITGPSAKQNRLFIGTQNIANTFKKLPATSHDFAPDKFAVDVWRTSNIRAAGDTGVVIALHGEFVEPQNGQARRSFDRTFVVLQGPNGQMLVASDMITIRPHSGNDAWKEDAAQAQPQAAAPPAAAPQGALPAGPPQQPQPQPHAPAGMNHAPPELTMLSQEQQMIVMNLMQATRLNAEYALMCAKEGGFDPQKSMALFEQSKANLPPNAYT